SFPGKVEIARPDLKNEIFRLPLEFLAVAGVPRPADPEANITGLSELHKICGEDAEEMKRRTVPGVLPAPPRRTAANIGSHVATLREEFATKPELLFYHATLISIIRRDVEVSDAFRHFESIWKDQTEFLRRELDGRWLISACDTFADYAKDPA